MDVVACPGPSCLSPAAVQERWTWMSTSGPVEHVKTECAAGHWFTPPAVTLVPYLDPTPARPSQAQPTR